MARIDEDVDSTNSSTVESHEDSGSNYLRSVLIELPSRIYQVVKQKLVDRAVCRHLLSLEDDHLRDIGVTRDEVTRASKEKNSTLVLQVLVSARRNAQETEALPVETELSGLDAGAKTSSVVNPYLLDLNDSGNHSSTSKSGQPLIAKDVSED